MLSKKILKIQHSYSFNDGSNNGFFFTFDKLSNRALHECSCREEFFHYFNQGTKLIGFTTPILNIKKLNEFFEKIENKLKLKKRTIFYKTNIDSVVLLEVPEFWHNSECRRSLFTLFLRAGAVYYTGDFDKAINSYNLAKHTKKAIHFFLDGYTIPTFQKIEGGWYSKFHGLDINEISRLLTQKSLISYGGIKMFPVRF